MVGEIFFFKKIHTNNEKVKNNIFAEWKKEEVKRNQMTLPANNNV